MAHTNEQKNAFTFSLKGYHSRRTVPQGTAVWRLVWLVSTLLMFTPLAIAQSTATISGFVRDPSGAVVPGATVTALMTEQNSTRTTITNSSGLYRFSALLPGSYTLTFTAQGFKTQVRSGVTLTVSESASVDEQLSVGAVATKVTVTAAAPLINSTTNTISGLVTGRRIVDLPLNGRNIMSLAALLPGVTDVSAPQTMIETGSGVRGGPTMSVSGQTNNANFFTLDGAYFADPSRDTGINMPPPDAIAQFRILTANFEAQYGFNAGSQVQVISKSGTNAFHGAAWEFLRNDAFNARNYFSSQVPAEKQNQFGAALGGPIVKNKLFFFASYQGLTDHGQSVSEEALVPSAAERNGDFTGLDTPLVDPVDPITGLPLTAPGGAPCVANNIINPGCISPVATNLLKYVPQTPSNTIVSLAANPITSDLGNIRVDWHQSEHNLLFGHYYQDEANRSDPISENGNLPGYVSEIEKVNVKNGVINDIYTFRPNLINQALFAVMNPVSSGLNNTTISATSLGINLPDYVAEGFPASGGPTVEVAGGFSLGGGAPAIFEGINYQISDGLTWVVGNHTFKFGFQLMKLHFQQLFTEPPSFTFDGVRSGNSIADYMLGAYDTAQVPFGVPTNNLFKVTQGYYAQDTWHAMPRLTLTYGIRYVPYLQWTETPTENLAAFAPGEQSIVQPKAPPGMLYAGDPGISNGIAPSELSNFAPRVGFAWDVSGNGKTSVRGGYGIFYNSTIADPETENNAPVTGNQFAFRGDIANPLTSTGSTNPPVSPSPTFDCSKIATYPFYDCGLFPLPINNAYESRNLKLGYIQEYDFSVQRQITQSAMIEVSYVGNKGSRLIAIMNPNPARFITDPITGAPPSETNVNDRVEFEPGILGPETTEARSYASSNYNALQIMGRLLPFHGATVMASYTWSKAFDFYGLYAPTRYPYGADPFDLSRDYGLANNNPANSFVVSWLYDLPFHFSNHVVSSMFGGWTVTAIQSVRSGLPITFLAGQDVALDGTGDDQFAELLPGQNPNTVRISHPSRSAMVQEFFNTAAFQNPNDTPPGTYGNSTRSMIWGPGAANTDASILKTFALPSFRLQLRLESFNTFNQVNFSNPNSTANSGTFGQILSAAGGRELQIGMKLLW